MENKIKNIKNNPFFGLAKDSVSGYIKGKFGDI